MADAHVHRKVEDLRVQLEVIRNAIMQHCLPIIRILFLLACIEADTISPEMAHFSHLKLQIVKRRIFGHTMGIVHEFEVKLVEIRVDVHTLKLWVHILVDKHEI